MVGLVGEARSRSRDRPSGSRPSTPTRAAAFRCRAAKAFTLSPWNRESAPKYAYGPRPSESTGVKGSSMSRAPVARNSKACVVSPPCARSVVEAALPYDVKLVDDPVGGDGSVPADQHRARRRHSRRVVGDEGVEVGRLDAVHEEAHLIREGGRRVPGGSQMHPLVIEPAVVRDGHRHLRRDTASQDLELQVVARGRFRQAELIRRRRRSSSRFDARVPST